MGKICHFMKFRDLILVSFICKGVGIEEAINDVFQRDISTLQYFFNFIKRENHLIVAQSTGVPIVFQWYVNNCNHKVCAI